MEKSLLQKSISYILLALILMFALTSIGNVAEFVHKYHEGWTGYTLGICFGVTLFTAAYLASVTKSNQTRKYALIVAGIFGTASATFQTSLYVSGGASWYIAVPLSFVPILAGEVGLALLESSYSSEHTHEVEQTAAGQLRQKVAQLEAQLEKQHELEQKHHADQATIQSLMLELEQIRQESADIMQSVTELNSKSIMAELPAKLRDDLAVLVDILSKHPVTSAEEFSNMSEWGRTKAHSVFQTAKAIRLIEFCNSDVNAYIVSEGS